MSKSSNELHRKTDDELEEKLAEQSNLKLMKKSELVLSDNAISPPVCNLKKNDEISAQNAEVASPAEVKAGIDKLESQSKDAPYEIFAKKENYKPAINNEVKVKGTSAGGKAKAKTKNKKQTKKLKAEGSQAETNITGDGKISSQSQTLPDKI